ncbi:MAG: hypothetical protein H8E32_09500 [Nitrospinae bacterium]|nr:hypothetical protein [Nitrospinota bacterium]
MKNKLFAIFLLTFVLSVLLPHYQVHSQDADEKFTTIGPIGISNKYTLPANRRAIVFRIKNYTSRSISQLFGRVFLIDKSQTDPQKKFLLINNPHKGGTILKGKPHRPGTISEWNFTLIREPLLANQNIEYTLQVHPRSIFFTNGEPIRKIK